MTCNNIDIYLYHINSNAKHKNMNQLIDIKNVPIDRRLINKFNKDDNQ